MNPFDRFKKPAPPPTTGDLTDPFRNDERNGTIFGFEKTAKIDNRYMAGDWTRHATQQEIEICRELGKRCSDLVTQLSLAKPVGAIIPPHPLHCAVDFLIVHLHRGLDLVKCLELDDLILTHQYAEIVKRINRPTRHFPADAVLSLPLLSAWSPRRIALRLKL